MPRLSSLVVIALLLASCGGGGGGGSNPVLPKPFVPILVATTGDLTPLQLIRLNWTGAALQAGQMLSGSIRQGNTFVGNMPIEASNARQLQALVPLLPAGKYQVEIDTTSFRAAFELELTGKTPPPDVAKAELDAALDLQRSLLQTLSTWEPSAGSNLDLKVFRAELAKARKALDAIPDLLKDLTTQEQIALAQFMRGNSGLLQGQLGTTLSGASLFNDEEATTANELNISIRKLIAGAALAIVLGKTVFEAGSTIASGAMRALGKVLSGKALLIFGGIAAASAIGYLAYANQNIVGKVFENAGEKVEAEFDLDLPLLANPGTLDAETPYRLKARSTYHAIGSRTADHPSPFVRKLYFDWQTFVESWNGAMPSFMQLDDPKTTRARSARLNVPQREMVGVVSNNNKVAVRTTRRNDQFYVTMFSKVEADTTLSLTTVNAGSTTRTDISVRVRPRPTKPRILKFETAGDVESNRLSITFEAEDDDNDIVAYGISATASRKDAKWTTITPSKKVKLTVPFTADYRDYGTGWQVRLWVRDKTDLEDASIRWPVHYWHRQPVSLQPGGSMRINFGPVTTTIRGAVDATLEASKTSVFMRSSFACGSTDCTGGRGNLLISFVDKDNRVIVGLANAAFVFYKRNTPLADFNTIVAVRARIR